MSNVRLDSVSKQYDDFVAVRALTLDIHEGEFITLLGPSGCGKTTTLRMIAGFTEPSGGHVYIDGDDVTDLPPQKRTIGMVFQDYALFPHLTIRENIEFGLVERKVPRDKVVSRVNEMLQLVRLSEVAHRFPSELSGGQQQRIALARAVAYPPRVLLMDEPLGALDLKMREVMQLELRRIQQTLRITTVYVTHDQAEAMMMSDRIAVMNEGQIEQLDIPENIYKKPRTKFVADFIGKVNFLSGRLQGRSDGVSIIASATGNIVCPSLLAVPVGTEITVAIRPECLKIYPVGENFAETNIANGEISNKIFVGNLVHVIVRLEGGVSLLVEAKPAECVENVGDKICLGWSVSDVVVIP